VTSRASGTASDVKFCDEKRLLRRGADKAFRYRLIAKFEQLRSRFGIGLNWYPNLNMKFMLDYEHVVVDNPQFFGGPNYRGATIDWIAARTQFVF
jgi:phosphate-selective porin